MSGRLRWSPVSVQKAQRFSEMGVPSPVPSQPPFLKDLPPASVAYAPKQPVTKKLKALIDENAYAGAFESAIKTVSRQRVPELDRIHTLYQFYYYVDALVTWIPGLRVWDWQGDIYHERTDY